MHRLPVVVVVDKVAADLQTLKALGYVAQDGDSELYRATLRLFALGGQALENTDLVREADEDMRALGGVSTDEELSDDVFTIARARFQWLFVNLLTAFLASAVIDLFKGSLEKMVALAVLMPIVASQGGNAGTQTMTVAVRALATHAIGLGQAPRIVWREALVGLLNGFAFAIMLGGVAAFWFSNPELGLVAGLAMLVNMVAAGLAGVLIPLALEKVGADPALSSGTFVTTVTDIVGFFAFLGVATFWFGLG